MFLSPIAKWCNFKEEFIDESINYMVTISLTLVDVVFVKLLERQNIVDAKLPLNTVGMHPNNSTQIQEHDVAI